MALYRLNCPNFPEARQFVRDMFTQNFNALVVPTQQECQRIIDRAYPTQRKFLWVVTIDVPDFLFQYLTPLRVQRPFSVANFMITDKTSNCSICLQKTKRRQCKLPCGHRFHRKCITTWFKESRTCPVCRAVALP